MGTPILNLLLRSYQRKDVNSETNSDMYNEVFEQQMIITDAFFSYCAIKDFRDQNKNCHKIHLHSGAGRTNL